MPLFLPSSNLPQILLLHFQNTSRIWPPLTTSTSGPSHHHFFPEQLQHRLIGTHVPLCSCTICSLPRSQSSFRKRKSDAAPRLKTLQLTPITSGKKSKLPSFPHKALCGPSLSISHLIPYRSLLAHSTPATVSACVCLASQVYASGLLYLQLPPAGMFSLYLFTCPFLIPLQTC